MADLVGHTIGQYQIVERLGRGGMADVYKAFHSGLAVYRALKVIRSEFIGESGFKERFQREAQAVATLRHPNIVQMHDFGVQDNLYYMVMEFIEGQDLKTEMAGRGQIRPFGDIVEIIEQVASALNYAHERGVIHRDIKPANIMLNPEGQAILTDFGIAKMVALEEQMTQTGVGIGTPAYMAPEQAKGQSNVGRAADIYSLGIVLYEMLTGRVPFSADTPLAVMMKVVNDPMLPPREFSPDIPDVLQGVVLKATAKDPAQRYPTAEAMVDALKRSLEAQPGAVPTDPMTQVTTPSPKPGPARQIRPWLVPGFILVLIFCMLLGGAGVWLFWPRPEPVLARWQFVIDASEGMSETIEGQTKMEIAQAALAQELDILPPNIEAGLRVFGSGISGQMNCDDTGLLVEAAAGQNEQLSQALAGVSPGGEAPLTKAIVQTIGDFTPNENGQHPLIIVITAGLDTCEENAMEQLEKLSNRLEFEYELHLIGLGVTETAEQAQLRQIAEVAGGEYHDAKNAQDIGAVFEEEVAKLSSVETPQSRSTADTGSPVATEESYTPAASADIPIVAAEKSDLRFGGMVSGAVTSAAEMDSYSFEGAADDWVMVRMSNSGDDELAPAAQLFGPDDKQICSSWQYAEQTLDLQCQLETDGRYTLLVGGYESRGQYTVYLQRTNEPADAVDIGFNETASAEVASAVERAAYTFEGAKDDWVVIRLVNVEGELAPAAQLFGPDGAQLCSSWQYANQTLDLQCQLEADGHHTLLVGGYESSGRYSLYLQRTNEPADAVDIGFNETVSGEVAGAVERAAYAFEGAEDDWVVIRLADAETELAPAAQLFGPDGAQLCSSWQYAEQTLDLQCQLEADGHHTLLVGGYESSGRYSLYLQRTNEPAGATVLEFGETVSGAVASAAELKAYIFEAAEADQVVITLVNTEGKLAPAAQLFGPDGTRLCSSWQYAEQTLDLQCQLEADGRQTLLVGGYESSGRYSLTLKRLN